ncbi:hypothetical protein ACFRI7_12915 [Streptomyces sp. NPDC056716]|uniref:hypothetical protein n=1 Tax=unclassified Streptomyces TaxID=2593676 RepID=UPI003693E4AE
MALEWAGNWHISADAEPDGAVRVRAGRVPHERIVHLAPGETLVAPGRTGVAAAPGVVVLQDVVVLQGGGRAVIAFTQQDTYAGHRLGGAAAAQAMNERSARW